MGMEKRKTVNGILQSANSKWKLENEKREMGYVKLKIVHGTWEKAKEREKGGTRLPSREHVGNTTPPDIQPRIVPRMGKDTRDIARYAGNRATVQACAPTEKGNEKET